MRCAHDGVACSGGQNSDGLGLAVVFCRFVEAKVRELRSFEIMKDPVKSTDDNNNISKSTPRTALLFSIDCLVFAIDCPNLSVQQLIPHHSHKLPYIRLYHPSPHNILIPEMGLFTSSSPPSLPPPKLTPDGAPIAPDRTQRAKCWEARDAYFSCLDKNNIIDSLGADKSKADKVCAAEGRGFEGNCASSWVTYFKKRRVMEWQREKTLEKLREEGAVKMPGELAPPQAPRS